MRRGVSTLLSLSVYVLSRVLRLSLERKHKNRFTKMANNKHKYDSDMFTIVSNEREGR